MGKTTIAWTGSYEGGVLRPGYSFNPWIGCSKVSAGCQFCYAEHDTFPRRERARGVELWGVHGERHVTSETYWKEPLVWDRAAERDGVRRRVLCASLADVFEARLDLDEPRSRLWGLIERTPHLNWMLLTKRPENIERMLPARWSSWGYYYLHDKLPELSPFPQNVWLGVSAENGEQFQARWTVLESVGQRWYVPGLFISAEPLLGPIDMRADLVDSMEHEEDNTIWTRGIDWVICGGESGRMARPMHPEWARMLRDQCKEAEVPFFFKSHGEWLHESQFATEEQREKGWSVVRREAGDGRQFVRVGRRLAGDVLDGKVQHEFPSGPDFGAETNAA